MTTETATDALHVVELRAENVKRLSAVQIRPDGSLVTVSGPNMSGKCLPGSARVLVDGCVEMRLDEAVSRKQGTVLGYTRDRIRPVNVTDWHKCGIREAVRLSLRGWPIDVASTHPVLTSRGWLKAEEVRVGDHVATPRSISVDGDLDVSDDEVRLGAYLIADGSLTCGSTGLSASHDWKADEFMRTLGAVFPAATTVRRDRFIAVRRSRRRGSVTPDLNARLASAVADAGHNISEYVGNPHHTALFESGHHFPRATTMERMRQDGVDLSEFDKHSTGSWHFARWVDRFGIRAKSSNKTLGSFARVPTSQVPVLIAALWFADGYVSATAREVSYTSASLGLVKQIRTQLLRIGVLASCGTKRVKGRPYYTIRLLASSAKDFAERVPLSGPKGERLRSANLGTFGRADALPIEIWSPHISDEDWRAKPWFTASRSMSREKFSELGGPQSITEQEVWWARVVSTSPIEPIDCYDLTVGTEEHAYIADGAVVHNSSLIDSIMYGLGGKAVRPSHPVRDGADEAEIVVDLGQYKIRRVIREGKADKLEVLSAEGAKFSSPQAMLDGLVGDLTFDPLDFSRKRPAEQAEILRQVAGIDTSDIDAEESSSFEARRIASRDHKAILAQLEAIPFDVDAPVNEQDASELAELVVAAQRAMDHAEQSTKKVEQLNAQIEKLVAEKQRLEAFLTDAIEESAKATKAAALADPQQLAEKLRQIESDNARARSAAKRRGLAVRAKKVEGVVCELQVRVGKARADRADRIASADMPLPGLSIGDGEVLVNDVPLTQASQGERLRVAAAIGMALNPTVRVLLIRDGSLLDKAGFAALAELAEERGFQVWVERVAEPGEGVGIVIEDGRQIGGEA